MDLFETLSSNGIHFIRIYIEILFAIDEIYYNQNEKNFETKKQIDKKYVSFPCFSLESFGLFLLKAYFSK